MLNLKPWMEHLTIQDKDAGSVIPLRLDDSFAWAQRELIKEVQRQYNLGLPVRIIVLKGRQLGISTASEGLLFNWSFLHPGSQSLVIAHETKAAQHLFEMTKLMWEEWPFHDFFTEKHNSQKQLGWEETRSSISVATARNAGSGRSFTYRAVHCSECAFWEDPELLLTGLNQSIPNAHGTIVIYESTANGVGNWFYDEWNRAVSGESSVVPMFFPWFRHQPYAFPNTVLTHRDMKKDERDLMKQYGLTVPQMAWRRYMIANACMGDELQFRQEYPCSPEEAFITTGTNVFPTSAIDECYDQRGGWRGFLYDDNGRIRFKRDPTGPLTIFQLPADDQSWGKYVVAGDPSRTAYGDGACIQVINRRTFEQVAVYHNHIEPIAFGHDMMRLGYFYNQALLNCEITGPGYATITAILENNYPEVWRWRWGDKAPGKVSLSYGWQMSYNRKHQAAGFLTNALAQNMMTIHDRITYNELKNFVTLPNGEMGPASPSGNDDTVTSLMIAVTTARWSEQLPYGPEPEPAYNDIQGMTMEEAFKQ